MLFFADLEKIGEINDKLPIKPIVAEFGSEYDVGHVDDDFNQNFRFERFNI